MKLEGLDKGVVGFMKDEMGDDKIIEWVALKSKSYAYRTMKLKECFRQKGISKTLSLISFLKY